MHMCRALPTGTGARLAMRILHMRAQCDNLWAVITLNGCCLEQVSDPNDWYCAASPFAGWFWLSM